MAWIHRHAFVCTSLLISRGCSVGPAWVSSLLLSQVVTLPVRFVGSHYLFWTGTLRSWVSPLPSVRAHSIPLCLNASSICGLCDKKYSEVVSCPETVVSKRRLCPRYIWKNLETHFFTRVCVCKSSVIEAEGGWGADNPECVGGTQAQEIASRIQ